MFLEDLPTIADGKRISDMLIKYQYPNMPEDEEKHEPANYYMTWLDTAISNRAEFVRGKLSKEYKRLNVYLQTTVRRKAPDLSLKALTSLEELYRTMAEDVFTCDLDRQWLITMTRRLNPMIEPGKEYNVR